MNDEARRLRAQKAYSTDPAYLERMAREEEARGINFAGPFQEWRLTPSGDCAKKIRSGSAGRNEACSNTSKISTARQRR
jgi:hypothetical protein